MKKQVENVELPPWKKTGLEDIFFNAREIDGYNKIWNFVYSPRGIAKTTWMYKKIYTAFRNEGRPSVILVDKNIDITEQFINDMISQYYAWTGVELPFQYSKADLRAGVLDIKLNNKIFIRMHSESTDVNKVKRGRLDNCKYFFKDEFIKNLRAGEKYEKDEPFKIKELYNTYQRYVKDKERGDRIRCYFFGNPYSKYCPLFTYFDIPSSKLQKGCIIHDKDWIVQCYEMKPELKEYILKTNPLYQFDDAYANFGLEGTSINDTNIRLEPKQPKNFKLQYLFKINDRYLGVFRGYAWKDNYDFDYCYWTCRYSTNEGFSKRREVVTFDFSQMEDGAVLASTDYKGCMALLKEAIRRRQITHSSIESAYMMEEIYQML